MVLGKDAIVKSVPGGIPVLEVGAIGPSKSKIATE
jgi:hypothetical protein